jgi:SAM-dependent methyltransferase
MSLEFAGAESLETIESLTPSKQRNFGINDKAHWLEQTEGIESAKPSNFLRYQRRTREMLETAVSVVSGQPKESRFFVTDFLKYKKDPEGYMADFKAFLEKSDLQNLDVLDIGAGTGSLFNTFERTGVFPNSYTAVEPVHNEFLKNRLRDAMLRYPKYANRIGLVEAGAGKNEMPSDLQADVIMLAGVAPYYKWEDPDADLDFKTILQDLETHVKPGGVIAFSFSLDVEQTSITTLPDKLRQTVEDLVDYKSDKSRFSQKDLEDAGYTIGPQIIIGNYVAYKKF